MVLDEGSMFLAGMSFEELSTYRSQALEAGKYASAGHGLVYMISDFNYIYNGGNERLLKVAPHVMFHAPNLTSRDIGENSAAAVANTGLPTINAEGPHGFMITFVQHSSDPARVQGDCSGQLPAVEKMSRFPPR